MAVSFTRHRGLRKPAMEHLLLVLCLLIVTLTAACSSSTDEPEVSAEESNDSSAGSSSLVSDPPDIQSDTNSGPEAVSEENPAVEAEPEGEFTIEPEEAVNPLEEEAVIEEPPEPFPSLSIEEENLHLEEALGLAPDDSLTVKFTHWIRVKRHNRLEELTSDFDLDSRKRFMVQVLKNNQAAAAMDKDFIGVQSDLWGWDSTDLIWESEVQFLNLMDYLNILHLRPNFDFDKLEELLLEREFTPTTYEGVTIYSLPLTHDVDWYNISPLSVHNMAVLPEEGLLILSPVIESVQKVIDTMLDNLPSFGDDPLVKRAAFQLVGMAAVEMQRGLETCEIYGAGNSTRGRLINAASEQLETWPVSPYQLMALGHAFSNEAQVDLVLFHYDDFRVAEADFESRENLIRLGTSPQKQVPYSAQFILQGAELDDALMTFNLVPSPSLSDRTGWPQTMIGWVQDQDALFAACVVEDFLGLDEMG